MVLPVPWSEPVHGHSFYALYDGFHMMLKNNSIFFLGKIDHQFCLPRSQTKQVFLNRCFFIWYWSFIITADWLPRDMLMWSLSSLVLFGTIFFCKGTYISIYCHWLKRRRILKWDCPISSAVQTWNNSIICPWPPSQLFGKTSSLAQCPCVAMVPQEKSGNIIC